MWHGKRKRLISLMSAAIVSLSLLLLVVRSRREPLYQGKPVDFWIASIAGHDPISSRAQEYWRK